LIRCACYRFIFSGAPSLRIHTRATAMLCETTLPFETDSFVNATLVVEQVQKIFWAPSSAQIIFLNRMIAL